MPKMNSFGVTLFLSLALATLPFSISSQVLSESDSLKIKDWRTAGARYFKEKNYEQAALYCDSVLQLKPTDYSARVNLSESYYRLGMYSLSVKNLDILLQQKPGSGELLYKRCISFYGMKDYDSALSDIDEYIKIQPSEPLGWYMKGLIQKNKVQANTYQRDKKSFYKKPIKNLEKAIDLSGGKYYEAWVVLGNIRKNIGEGKEALQCYEHAIECDSTKGLPYILIGEKILSDKDTASALDYFYKALEIDGDDRQVQEMVNDHYMDLGLFDQVSIKMDSLIALDSSSLEGWLGRGILHLHQKKYADALVCFDTAIHFHPGSTNAYYLRGLTWISLKDKKKAGDDLRYAASLGHAGAKEVLKNDLRFSESWLPFVGEVLKKVPWYLYY